MATHVRTPIIELLYEGTNISEDIAPYLNSLTFTDKIDSDSPDIDISLNDHDQLWQDDWFPSAKDKITLKMFYEFTDDILDAGIFEVDDVEFGFGQSGDTLKIGAQATPVSKNLREKRSKEYEKVTLKAIVDEVAARQSLTVQGAIVDVTFDRLTQNEESDLVFLARISADYGQLFKIEADKLIFYNYSDLDAQETVFQLTRAEITGFSARKKLVGTYKSAKLVYEKGEDEEPIEVVIEAEIATDSEDVLVINERAEDGKQAELKAKEKLRQANADEYTGSLSLEGEPRYLAGLNFDISGFGAFDGKWQIKQAKHSFSSSQGWTTSLDVRRVSPVEVDG